MSDRRIELWRVDNGENDEWLNGPNGPEITVLSGVTDEMVEAGVAALRSGMTCRCAEHTARAVLEAALGAAVLRNPGSSPQWIDSEAFEGPVEVEPWERNPGSSE